MAKKLLLLLPLFIGFGCCTDIKEFYNISDFTVEITGVDMQPLLVNTIIADTLVLQINYTPEFVENEPSFNFLMNAAYAVSCEDSGQKGMEDKLLEIIVTSNHEFNDISAGEPINSFVEEMDTGSSISDFITDFAASPYDSFTRFNFLITEKPDEPEHTFTLQLIFQSGETLESQTGRIQWN